VEANDHEQLTTYSTLHIHIHLYSPSNGSMKEKNIHTYKINNKQIQKQD